MPNAEPSAPESRCGSDQLARVVDAPSRDTRWHTTHSDGDGRVARFLSVVIASDNMKGS